MKVSDIKPGSIPAGGHTRQGRNRNKEGKTMSRIDIIRCPSGFWAVMVDGQVWTAASPTREHAESIAKDLERRTGR